ncbi:MAG: M20/M25/M40 family metallo-hydrolase [Bacteroidota bacterium]|nr:M20/M25/M40 family metallo-hydrolase [Bacteroidota bacterium]
MIRLFLCMILCAPVLNCSAQDADSVTIRNIYTFSLEKGKAYVWLDSICNKIGTRFTGTVGAEKAIAYTKTILENQQYGTVYLQEVMVPRWRRNSIEELTLSMGSYKTKLMICSLGGSIGTPSEGISANVVEVSSFDELDKLGKKVAGKMVFFNVPMEQKHVLTFTAYSKVGTYRYSGAQRAAKHGAVASITRSLTLALDNNPHAGSMGYADSVKRIPACAVSTQGAEFLSAALKNDPGLKLELKMNCDTLPDTLSYNVIAEIKGTEFPDEIIVVGAHLDSWDKGQGAHDDGAGCVQAMEVIRIFKELKIQPKRTVRVVLFMNEENGLRGGKKYAAVAKEKGENHIAAIESDAGGFTPHGFSSECIDSTKRANFLSWKSKLLPYGLYNWSPNWGGADIGPLKEQGTLLIGLLPDSQRYFDYHHADSDTFDKVNRRELQLGSAAMASLVYLLSEHGVK